MKEQFVRLEKTTVSLSKTEDRYEINIVHNDTGSAVGVDVSRKEFEALFLLMAFED